MAAKLILLFAAAALASPGHLKLDFRKEHVSAAALEERDLEDPLKLAIGGSVSRPFPTPSPSSMSGHVIARPVPLGSANCV